ncbi:hypothetical protein ONS95_013148 [Cadophora gregata]|uniref:uncharacterized protein n=1 Tax=Cadophora gregata TaxID=51156 RepID=UPI0026DC0EDA|nr:uncharacterized protein ONS95_013148 [Cadophora gregata]KAK0100037.1 hypothetical protein ONS96_007975 [Cadophora gregata f. sp. sojae]KAK0116116.1 hypothetical protein ONS95_013148 [Cadophora gregata]
MVSTRIFNGCKKISDAGRVRTLQDALQPPKSFNFSCCKASFTMKSLLFLSIIHLALGSSDVPTIPNLDHKQPIYLGESFYPPTMTFVAWQGTEENTPKDWCIKSADCSDHRIFSLGGVEGLQIHDYFDKVAYLTRMGNRFADCVVTPESVKMGICDGRAVSETGTRFTGRGTRKWSCWVSEQTWLEARGMEGERKEELPSV